jgi:hypothetical protein
MKITKVYNKPTKKTPFPFLHYLRIQTQIYLRYKCKKRKLYDSCKANKSQVTAIQQTSLYAHTTTSRDICIYIEIKTEIEIEKKNTANLQNKSQHPRITIRWLPPRFKRKGGGKKVVLPIAPSHPTGKRHHLADIFCRDKI